MKVSIIIPTFNRPDRVIKAINSAMLQTYQNKEIIVIDNASDYGDLLDLYPDLKNKIIYHRHSENIGMYPNWNYALEKLVKGDFAMILSDDDLLICNNYIQDAMNLSMSSNTVLIHSNCRTNIVSEKKESLLTTKRNFKKIISGEYYIDNFLKNECYFKLLTVIFNVEIAKEVGFFSRFKNEFSADFAMFLRMCNFGKVGFINRNVAEYTVHNGNETVNSDLIKWIENFDTFVSLTLYDKRFDQIWLSKIAKEYIYTRLVDKLCTDYSISNVRYMFVYFRTNNIEPKIVLFSLFKGILNIKNILNMVLPKSVIGYLKRLKQCI